MQSEENYKQIGGVVPADVKDALTAQTKERGQVQQRAVTSALRVWLVLPDDLQATIMRSAPKSYEDFVELIRLRDLPAAIASLSEKQRIAMDNPATRLLEHSSPVTTQTYYTDQELLDKLRVNLLPVDDWLGA